MKRGHHALLSVAVCFMLLVTSMAVFYEGDETEQQQEITLAGSWWDDFAQIGIGLKPDNSNPEVLTMLLSPIIGLGWILRGYYEDQQPSVLDEVARQHESDLVYTILHFNNELLENSIDGYGDIWKFTNQYWMRQSEIASAELWQTGNAYSSVVIAERSGLYDNLSQLFINIQEGPDKTFDLINERLTAWSNTDGYNSMQIIIEYGSQGTSHQITDKNNMDVIVRSALTAKQGSDMAYLVPGSLYAWGSNPVIYAKNGTPYALHEGYNDLSQIDGFKAGVYQFAKGNTYAGTIMPALTSNAAHVSACAVISSGSSYTLAGYENGKITVNGTSYDNLSLKVATGSSTSERVDIVKLIRYYDAIVRAAEDSLTKSHKAALTAWQLYTNANEANILISPSSLVPDLDNVEISQEQMYALTVLYLQQIYDMYKRVGGKLETTGFALSPESIDLYVRGDVFDETGQLLYKDVVMSPYIWLRDLTLSLDKVTINQPGTLALWGNSTDLKSWTGVEKGEAVQTVQMESGYVLDIKEMIKSGSSTNSITLTVMEIEPWDNIVKGDGWKPIDTHDKGLIATLVMIICIELAAILCLLWHETDEILLLIVAIIVAAIGIFASSWIAGLL